MAEKPHWGTMPNRAPTTGPAAPARRDERPGARAGGVLEQLEGQIGQEQKRDERQRVLHAVLDDMPEQIHYAHSPRAQSSIMVRCERFIPFLPRRVRTGAGHGMVLQEFHIANIRTRRTQAQNREETP